MDDDRPGNMVRAVERLEDGVKIVGKRGGNGESKMETEAEKAGPTVVAEPRSYTDQDVASLTPDQVRAAAARGSLKAPQM